MRITKETKAIADRHIAARLSGNFDDVVVKSKEEIIQALKDGKTIAPLLDEIETRFTSITSIMLSRVLFHQSQNYRNGVYKGFKILLQG